MARKRMRFWIGSAALAFSSLAMAGAPSASSAPAYDTVLKGGTIYTGDAPPFVGDVAISGDKIVYVGRKAPGRAGKTINAHNLVVAPGFIDPHTHAGDALLSENPVARLLLPFLTQGVTTVFIGGDGLGSPNIAKTLGTIEGAAAGETRSGYGVNFATYVGFGAVRSAVIGQSDRAPTSDELGQMQTIVANAMCEGAMGLSSGLFYAPQSFAKRDEVTALARIAGSAGGVYDTHLRDESSYSIGLLASIDEALAIGRDASIPLHIAHIKALGVDVQGMAPQVISKIEAAQASGQIVSADQYPWSASGTGLSAALIPRWAQDGGRAAMLDRFANPETRSRMRPEIEDNLRRRGGPAALLITAGPIWAIGKTLKEIAEARATDPVVATMDLLSVDEVKVASFNQSESDIAQFMQRPWVVTSSDASLGHPRYYGSFARKYDTYVRDRKVIDLRTFIASSTIRPARIFGLKDRGELRAGAYADIVAFDPRRFRPRADYMHPTAFSTGVVAVLVNGKIAIEDGAATGMGSGLPLPGKGRGTKCSAPE